MWARGHMERWYRSYPGDLASEELNHTYRQRTYEFSHLRGPHPNQARVQRKIADNLELARKVGLA